MARSGTITFSLTTQKIVRSAIRQLGAYAPGSVLGDDQYDEGEDALNLAIKSLANQGVLLHVQTEGHLFLVKDQESYDLGTGGDEATSDYVKTEVKAAASSGDTTIDVDSITDISDGDYIGIELDGGDLQWTTVDGAPSGDTVTLDAALTDDVAVDNHVYAYTTIIEKPQRILRGTVRIETESGTELPVRLVSREEYMNLPLKSATGTINQVYYDQQYGTTGKLYTWPTCENVKHVLHFTFERLLEDVSSILHSVDFPVGAEQMLVYATAVYLAPTYPKVDPNRMAWIKAIRDELIDDYLSRDSEEGSLFFQPAEVR